MLCCPFISTGMYPSICYHEYQNSLFQNLIKLLFNILINIILKKDNTETHHAPCHQNKTTINNNCFFIRRLIKNEIGHAILRVISGNKAFKVVLFTRLTPIPFGIQNTIFGVSTKNTCALSKY